MTAVSFAWQLRKTIMVAVPYEPPSIEQRRVDVHELIACATCRARVDESCRTSSGQRRRSHELRFAPYLCPCGERRGGKGWQLCVSCAEESTRTSKREHMRRKRAAA